MTPTHTTATPTSGRATAAVSTAASDAATPTGPNREPAPSGVMHALVRDRYGEADRVELRAVAIPRPAPGEVVVRVEAAGVDRGVWHLMTGLPYLVRFAGYGVRRPKQPVLGLDLSGRVVAVGDAVTRFRIGDAVFGIGSGSFAEYAVADERTLAHRPDGLAADQAAAAAISGITALQALRDIGRVEAGQRVLVLGASGGVGTFAVQIAGYLGADVTGVASTGKLDLVRSLGSDLVLDYTIDDALDGSERYDLILDIGGRSSVRRLRRGLARRGTAVIVGGEGGGRLTGGIGRQLRAMLLSPFVSQRLTTFVSAERGDDIERIGELLAAGDVRAVIDRVYRLDEGSVAIRDLTAGRISGKAVIRVTTDG